MFTGIIESVGTVVSFDQSSISKLTLKNPFVFDDIKRGSSVSVNGICLTVLDFSNSGNEQLLEFEVSKETKDKTSIGNLSKGSLVNLERALNFNGRLDGHFVLGHVDTTLELSAIKKMAQGFELEFKYPNEFSHLIVEKGSISIDGISLTAFGVSRNSFKVSILPFTYESTNLKGSRTGNIFNCEFDVIGKYVHKFNESKKNSSKITAGFLKDHGFAS